MTTHPPGALAILALLLPFSGCPEAPAPWPTPAGLRCPDAAVIRRGEATFYRWANGGGACMFDPTPNDLMVGAMNATDYANAAACGTCVRLSGPRSEITIRIVDLCPECPPGNIDLSPQAFLLIGDTAWGRAPISWRVIPCSVTGPIVYHFKDGSNQWWTAVQIRNHRNPVFSLEYRTDAGGYRSVSRTSYNYFVEPSGMGPGPYAFRVTDIYGHVMLDSGVVHRENGGVGGREQFPPCEP